MTPSWQACSSVSGVSAFWVPVVQVTDAGTASSSHLHVQYNHLRCESEVPCHAVEYKLVDGIVLVGPLLRIC